MTGYDKTYIGIDYGRRRIGLAKSDPTGLIASALTTLEVKSDEDATAQLGPIIDQYQPRGLVIGYPLHTTGEISKQCLIVDRFSLKLSELFDGPIHKVDESYSSEEAADVIHAHGKRVGTDKKRIDRIAAVIILQRFLDEQT